MGRFNKFITSLDSFGAPVGLNFHGSSSFNTASGGIITLITYAFVGWLTIALLIDTVTLDKPRI